MEEPVMIKYWVIAPYHATQPEIWEKVWQYDLANEVISIGWRELGDFSSYTGDELKSAIEQTYSTESTGNKTRIFNMLWNFYHEIEEDDIVIARKGRKRIAAVGTVTQIAYYTHAKNTQVIGDLTDDFHSQYIGVQWHDNPRDKEFDRIVFGMQTIYNIPESQFKSLIGESNDEFVDEAEDVKDHAEFVLEKYLEEFIVSNFTAIFGDDLVIYQDPSENVGGQQYTTDVGVIDILAQDPNTGSFVVIELKKGRESDRVIGQILRYMGWVHEKLCSEGQAVKGMIICREANEKLSYALKMTGNIGVKYYRIDFKLSDSLPGSGVGY